jgi:hypothetical protein
VGLDLGLTIILQLQQVDLEAVEPDFLTLLARLAQAGRETLAVAGIPVVLTAEEEEEVLVLLEQMQQVLLVEMAELELRLQLLDLR